MIRDMMCYHAQQFTDPHVRVRQARNLLDFLALGQTLLRCYTSATSLVELFVRPPRVARNVSDRPVATPLARWQASVGPHVTNLRHELITLGDFERQLLRQLDGTRDREQLVTGLTEVVHQGQLTVPQEGVAVREAGPLRDALASAIESQLPMLAGNSLLIG
jgi:hypothetical protein